MLHLLFFLFHFFGSWFFYQNKNGQLDEELDGNGISAIG